MLAISKKEGIMKVSSIRGGKDYEARRQQFDCNTSAQEGLQM